MNCYAWKIPEGCYAYALGGGEECPSATWWWIALAAAAGLLLVQDGKKARPARSARVTRAKRK